MGGGEKRNLNISLVLGAASQTVEVNAQETALVTTDSGEKSFTLETKELENFIQVGSNAAEYIKITPGFGIQNGTSNHANYTGQTIGINANGDSGSQSPLNAAYSYNGLPTNSLDITADGAHVSDPGCNCDTPVNPNSDFVQEFKVLTSNFSAENQKGPILITSVTKAGGTEFHGSAFFSARNHSLNSNDWLNNASGVKQPANSYYYPGGTIGGPIIIPGTNFNKSRQKLFFWTGFEYYKQTLDTGLLRATVPTPGELTGDFSQASVDAEGFQNSSGVYMLPDGKPVGQVSTTQFPGGQIPACSSTVTTACIDPNMQALMKLFPAPNANPATTAGGYNYTQSEVFSQNNTQWTIRGDYNISDNTKVFVRYNYQRETQQFPVGLWWRNGDQVPYPTPIEGKNKSNSTAGTLTHVFSPTMTNETVVAYTFVGFPNVFSNPSAVDRTKVGYNYPGVFNNGVAQIPSFGQFGPSEAALVFNPGGFEAGGPSQGLYANKYMPSVSDTITKVVKNHTLKAGFFYEWIRNAQPANNNSNGELLVSSGNTYTTGNEYADLITGNLNSYNEANFNRINDIDYTTYEFFLQDSWKATKRLTIDFGMRFTHFTPWEDRKGFGYSIFNMAAYSPSCAAAPTYCGFEWHSADSSVPIGGFPTRSLFYQPRVGAAYDLFGKGKTVLRGGWGRFYYHSGQFTSGLDASAGVKQANLSPTNWVGNGTAGCPANTGTKGNPLYVSYFSCLNIAASPASPAAVDSTDDKQPYTDSWSVTVGQQTPWQGYLEVAYVGNRSRDLANTSNGYGSDINLVPLGAMQSATDPVTGNPNTNPGLANANDWRPLQGYGDLDQATNNLYANYNALQVTWVRHAGRYTIQANYTYGKALGIVAPTYNPFNLRSNYGILPADRRQIFNIAYSLDEGNLLKSSNHFLNGAANGWQLSGILSLESGPDLTTGGSTQGGGGTPNGNYNMSLTCVATAAELAAGEGCPNGNAGGGASGAAIIPGSNVGANLLTGIPIGNQSILGTNAAALNPLVTCNPNSGLGSHQYINANCFAAPTTVGQNGPTLLPVSYGPAYFNWDMGIFKNFPIKENMKVQFRADFYNWMNHPLYSFNGSNLNLSFVQDPVTQQFTQTNSNFGTTTEKQGNRIIQLAVKFFF